MTARAGAGSAEVPGRTVSARLDERNLFHYRGRVRRRPVVRLYSSSFRMGDHPEQLAALVGGDVRNVVVTANALDDAPADVRRSGLERALAALADLGFDGAELDLRDYFGQEE